MIWYFLMMVVSIEGMANMTEGPDLWISESRQLFWKARQTEDHDSRRKLADDSLRLAEKAREARPEDPSSLFAWLAAKGEVTQLQNKLVAVKELPKLEKVAIRLKEISPSYEHGAADRILGRLYHQAPSFISIGSSKKARASFEAAMQQGKDFPANQIYYAEFLLDEGEKEKARALAQQAMNSPLLAKYPHEKPEWIKMARGILEKSGGALE